uniref:Putative secreted protein n=1 Tax=Anopheles triannulatus TaxID=58253 RepID=A0A2M4B6Y0_9DIPT
MWSIGEGFPRRAWALLLDNSPQWPGKSGWQCEAPAPTGTREREWDSPEMWILAQILKLKTILVRLVAIRRHRGAVMCVCH